MDERAGRPWHVFATYLAAVAGIFATTSMAVEVLRALYPDAPALTIVSTLPGLLAGSLAPSSGLLLTLLLVVPPPDPLRLRLEPGGETRSTLAAALLALRALGPGLVDVNKADRAPALARALAVGDVGVAVSSVPRQGFPELLARCEETLWKAGKVLAPGEQLKFARPRSSRPGLLSLSKTQQLPA